MMSSDITVSFSLSPVLVPQEAQVSVPAGQIPFTTNDVGRGMGSGGSMS